MLDSAMPCVADFLHHKVVNEHMMRDRDATVLKMEFLHNSSQNATTLHHLYPGIFEVIVALWHCGSTDMVMKFLCCKIGVIHIICLSSLPSHQAISKNPKPPALNRNG